MVIAEDLFRKLSEDKFFTKLDLSKGYWQIPVARKDVHKTAFVTPNGKYKFVKMPFGMVNAGATLMKAMRRLLGGTKYVDNIIITLSLFPEGYYWKNMREGEGEEWILALSKEQV